MPGNRLTIRLPEGLVREIEAARDPEEFPSLSDFIRRAIERYVIEVRKARLRRECQRLAQEEDLSVLAEVDMADYAARMKEAEQGEL
ncbi:MAG TPA: ribbon-helix-helix protein, CopG family [Firmicutes bacterium]|nr:ribbon-helix-helix protein, CopG family [Bacillota bacterium]